MYKFLHILLANLPLTGTSISGDVGFFAVTGSFWIIVLGAWHFSSEFFEGLSFGLRNEESCENTAKHEATRNISNKPNEWRSPWGKPNESPRRNCETYRAKISG